MDSQILLDKCIRAGLHPNFINVLKYWLEGRTAHIICGGKSSNIFPMMNMVFQGTVLGPLSWNIFFREAGQVIRSNGFIDVEFADDVNGLRFYPLHTGDHFIEADVRQVQTGLHIWGEDNRVTFDSSKESHHILSRAGRAGAPFRLLGINFDTKLSMAPAVLECISICNSKLRALLRARKYYTNSDVLRLFKAHLLSLSNTGRLPLRTQLQFY